MLSKVILTKLIIAAFQRTRAIHEFIILRIKKHLTNIIDITAKYFTMIRLAVNKYLKKLIVDKLISEPGKKRNKSHELIELEYLNKSYSLTHALGEYKFFNDLNKNILDI